MVSNFEDVYLGVQVDAARIVEEALRLRPRFIGLSGLISPSLLDQRLMHTLMRLLRPDEAGVSVTVNGALSPLGKRGRFLSRLPPRPLFHGQPLPPRQTIESDPI